MLNPSPDAGINSLFEPTSQMDVPASTTVASLTLTAPTLTPPTIPTVSRVPQAPTPPTTAPSTLLQDLPNFGSLFGFDHRLKTLEANFFEFVQTNQFVGAVSSIHEIIIKDQVKVQASKILPKIEKTMNEQLEVKVLTRSSNLSKTSYVIAANLLEIELKKILIEKMESNKSIHRSDKQRNLYKALVEVYKSNKIILDTYGDTVTLKRRHDDADKDEEPSARSDRGSKRCKEGKEPELTSAPKEKATKTTSKKSARDVYSKRRIIVVTKLQIVEWHNYKHLDWITVHRDDDKLYMFKEGDFKRLRIQDIKDMLLLLVQGKLTNLTVEECFAFNVSLRMFTRSIVIQRRVKDLELGVKSYQKKLNLTKLDTYRSDMKGKEAYTAYFNPRGFIYQNKDKTLKDGGNVGADINKMSNQASSNSSKKFDLILSRPKLYAKLVIEEPSRTSVDFRTLLAPSGNGANVTISLEYVRAISECFANTVYGFFWGKQMAFPIVDNYFSSKDGMDAMLENGPWFILNTPFILKNKDGLSAIATKLGTPLMFDSYTTKMCMQSWGMSSYARAMIELLADVEVKDTIMVVMPKLIGEGFYLCTIHVNSDVAKNLMNPRQAARGVAKQDVVPRQEVSNSNSFDELNSIENDDDFGTNGKNSKSAGKGSLHVTHGSCSDNPIIDKIDKLEHQIFDGKVMFVDDNGKPLVPTGNVDSDGKVEVVFDETKNLMASMSFKGVTEVMVLIASWNNGKTKWDDDYDPRSNRRRVPNIVEPEIRIIEKVVPMADRTMEELLHAPTEGYGEAVVIPEILAENFEIKTNLLQDMNNIVSKHDLKKESKEPINSRIRKPGKHVIDNGI
nr:hypothetical protein [Tanacetum cinerariifolium]